MAASDDDEWRFSLEDLEEEGDGNGDSDGDGEPDGTIAGTLRSRGPIEPGDVDPENAFFVLVGVLIAGLFVGAVLSLLL